MRCLRCLEPRPRCDAKTQQRAACMSLCSGSKPRDRSALRKRWKAMTLMTRLHQTMSPLEIPAAACSDGWPWPGGGCGCYCLRAKAKTVMRPTDHCSYFLPPFSSFPRGVRRCLRGVLATNSTALEPCAPGALSSEPACCAESATRGTVKPQPEEARHCLCYSLESS